MQGKTIHPVVPDFMENRKAILKALHQLSEAIYVDACDHGLWEDPTEALDNPNGMKYVRRRCTLLIREELSEACEAAGDAARFAEELADVIIMAMSTALHLRLDLPAALMKKVLFNQTRPYKHGKELDSCTTCRTK